METLNRRITRLNAVAIIMLISLLVMIFFFAPTELTMGNVHRLLYFHVGTAWAASLTFFVALIAGIQYLRTRDNKWDIISMSSVEVGIVLFTMTIAAGAIWGRPAWNTWWIWSPRLIGVTVTWLVYVAYFMLRAAIDDRDNRARFAALYVIIAFSTVITTYLSVRFWRDIHPVVIGGVTEAVSSAAAAQGESEFANGVESIRMVITLNYSFIVFTVIYVAWLANRYRLELLATRVDQLKASTIARLRH